MLSIIICGMLYSLIFCAGCVAFLLVASCHSFSFVSTSMCVVGVISFVLSLLFFMLKSIVWLVGVLSSVVTGVDV